MYDARQIARTISNRVVKASNSKGAVPIAHENRTLSRQPPSIADDSQHWKSDYRSFRQPPARSLAVSLSLSRRAIIVPGYRTETVIRSIGAQLADPAARYSLRLTE